MNEKQTPKSTVRIRLDLSLWPKNLLFSRFMFFKVLVGFIWDCVGLFFYYKMRINVTVQDFSSPTIFAPEHAFPMQFFIFLFLHMLLMYFLTSGKRP